ncbi:ABC transporter ATP-binding protein [Cupriavidus sp. CV2]|uniref:ABC transporter ATP-binding protein n=1 Tax=Cupriavidus ulmosensis TaxID=3065913 RepID=UPI00296AA477|nr:ABC transporter ATP-binding protein [Cupriavidus sp. CV2]MDW3689145.1 ABC transporter ATP-binding protein [Cupriavidus sp. CV2]
MLEAIGLGKSYGTRVVVKEVAFTVAGGEITGLLGPNGAGKSTTVAMLCGLVAPDAGRVLIGGRALQDADARAVNLLKRRIGLVPQELSLYEELPARANLELFGALYGLSGSLLRERTAEALALVGLSARARDKPAHFSGGMKRRLNIACALVHDPDILIFDEPTTGVDPQSRNAIFDSLEALRERGKALLYTTHYMEEAERLCDRIVIMDHGQVVASDKLAGLYGRLPVAETLQVTVDGALDAAQLAHDCAAHHVRHAQQSGEVLSVDVDDLACAVPAVMAWLAARGHAVRHLASSRATLEDVFLALTGRQLRDGA